MRDKIQAALNDFVGAADRAYLLPESAHEDRIRETHVRLVKLIQQLPQ